MSVGSEHRKRRMKAATTLTGAAAVLREYTQDHLAHQVDEVSTGIATDRHYGRPVQ
jgi:hypothetical protein